MRYLGNNHIGFDSTALGFPSIKGCQAIVYQTSQGLYGFHDMKAWGGKPVDEAKSKTFALFVQGLNIPHEEHAVCLYGVINQTEQYGSDDKGIKDWKGMLLLVTKALKFKGPIYGYRVTEHITKGESVYVRFDKEDTKCRISYKRWSKMDYDESSQLELDPKHQQVVYRKSEKKKPEYGTKNPYEDLFPIIRKPKEDNSPTVGEGNLHVVAETNLIQFR